MANGPLRREYGDHEHDRRFHRFSHSRAETRDDPKCANGSKHEAWSEYEHEIEHASFQNRHNIWLSLSAPPIVATVAKEYKAYHWT